MNATELAEQFRTIANELRHHVDRNIGADRLNQWLTKCLESFHKVFRENSEKFGYSPPDAKPASSVEFVCRWLGVERVKLFPDVRFRIDFEGGHRFTHNEAERVTHYEAYSRWLADLLDRFSTSIESSIELRSYGPNGPILKWRKIDSPLAGLQIVREVEQPVTPNPKPDTMVVEKWFRCSPAEKRVLELYSESSGKMKPARINKQIRLEFEENDQVPVRWTAKTKQPDWDDSKSASDTIDAAKANGILVKLSSGAWRLSPAIQSELQADTSEVFSKIVI